MATSFEELRQRVMAYAKLRRKYLPQFSASVRNATICEFVLISAARKNPSVRLPMEEWFTPLPPETPHNAFEISERMLLNYKKQRSLTFVLGSKKVVTGEMCAALHVPMIRDNKDMAAQFTRSVHKLIRQAAAGVDS